MLRLSLLFLLLTGASSAAQARTLQPGQWSASLMAGPSLRTDKLLGGSRALGALGLMSEYVWMHDVSLILDLRTSLASSKTLALAPGLRYRLGNLGLALIPFIQAELVVAGLFNILGANMIALGPRLALGFDYHLTRRWAVGTMTSVGPLRTMTRRPAWFTSVDVLAFGTFFF